MATRWDSPPCPDRVTYKANLASGNEEVGFELTSVQDVVVEDNVASANATGILINFGITGVFTGNTVTANNIGLDSGFVGAVDVRRNAFVGNAVDGVLVDSAITLTQNNIYGNGSCGVRNNTRAQLVARQNFWGAPAGPSSTDPADPVCNQGGSSLPVVTPVATKPFTIPVNAGP